MTVGALGAPVIAEFTPRVPVGGQNENHATSVNKFVKAFNATPHGSFNTGALAASCLAFAPRIETIIAKGGS